MAELKLDNCTDICPTCHVNRTVLKEMLKDAPSVFVKEDKAAWREGDNHALARILVLNCPECKTAIKITDNNEMARMVLDDKETAM